MRYLFPHKTCTLDCVYYECGKTTNQTQMHGKPNQKLMRPPGFEPGSLALSQLFKVDKGALLSSLRLTTPNRGGLLRNPPFVNLSKVVVNLSKVVGRPKS
ncbi:MAG: hypothetical protein A7315_06045 [Candidatus Altiarchaeales archaeon WOR_SM1_79]|nr:MAG: hypothetical protein A7315_06045 [Candidatus Altiarchaeales archaeon WOR_SM1_79]